MGWFQKGFMQGITASLLVQTGVAAVITTAILGVAHWFFGLTTAEIISLSLIVLASTVFLINQSLSIWEWWRSSRQQLRFIFDPVEFGQNNPPYGELQLFRMSDVDPHIRNLIETEKMLPPNVIPRINDGNCMFALYRVGVKNKTKKTVRRVKLEFTKIKNTNNAFLPTLLRLMHSDDSSIDLAPEEKAFFDVVSAPVLTQSQWKKGASRAISELVIHYANPKLANRMHARTYDFCLTARGDNVNPETSWFRLEKGNKSSFDFVEIERGADG